MRRSVVVRLLENAACVAVLFAAIGLVSLSERVGASWDYTYGSPGPADYSEFLDVYSTSEGGAILVGQWAGVFEGMDAGESYRLFVQYRDPDGTVQWTQDAAAEVNLIPDSTYTSDQCTETFSPSGVIDGDDTVFITVAWCTGVNLYIAADPDNGVTTLGQAEVRERLGLVADTDPSYEKLNLLGASPLGGALYGFYADSNAEASPMIATLDRNFEPVWVSSIPEDAANLVSFSQGETTTAFAVTMEGGIWIATWLPRPLPHMNDALLLIEIEGDGELGPTIQHFGYECATVHIPRVTAEAIWVYGCDHSDSIPDINGGVCCSYENAVLSFATEDGLFLGEVGGLSEQWRREFWSTDFELVLPDWLANPENFDESDWLIPYEQALSDWLETNKPAERPGAPYVEYCYDYWEYLGEPEPTGPDFRGDHCIYLAPFDLQPEVTKISADGSYAFMDTTQFASDNIPPFIATWRIFGEGSETEFFPIAVLAIDNQVQISDVAPLNDTSALVVGSTVGADGATQRNRISAQSTNRSGFLASISLGGGFVSLPAPKRLLDTRSGSKVGELDGSGSAYSLQVTGQGGVPSSGVSAVALNVTAVSAEAGDYGGFVTVYPCGTRPDASNLNFTSGQTIPNSVIAPVSSSGKVCFYVYGKAHLLTDVSGYLGS